MALFSCVLVFSFTCRSAGQAIVIVGLEQLRNIVVVSCRDRSAKTASARVLNFLPFRAAFDSAKKLL
jgi:hypothetical protein